MASTTTSPLPPWWSRDASVATNDSAPRSSNPEQSSTGQRRRRRRCCHPVPMARTEDRRVLTRSRGAWCQTRRAGPAITRRPWGVGPCTRSSGASCVKDEGRKQRWYYWRVPSSSSVAGLWVCLSSLFCLWGWETQECYHANSSSELDFQHDHSDSHCNSHKLWYSSWIESNR